MATIYLDYNATTPVDPRVLEAMLPYFSVQFGNAASRTHSFGWTAAQAVDDARERVAALLGAETQEIIFTSGSTESINLALKGTFAAYRAKGKHFVVAMTEHKAVIDTCKAMEKEGAEISWLAVDKEGKADVDQLKALLRPDTVLVAVMLANNETGTIQPVEALAKATHENGSIFFCDATQAAGKMHVQVNELGVDLCCISAHKMYGPKGVGALYVRRKNPRVALWPQIHGGGHERGLRSGTLNVPGIVGLGKAAEIAAAEWWDDAQRLSILRTKLEQRLTDLGNVFINGSIRDRIANTTNISIEGVKADRLITKLPQLAMATGSACTSAIPEPSHVLKAMGLPDTLAYSSLRISLGKPTTEEEANKAAELLCNQIQQLRYESRN